MIDVAHALLRVEHETLFEPLAAAVGNLLKFLPITNSELPSRQDSLPSSMVRSTLTLMFGELG